MPCSFSSRDEIIEAVERVGVPIPPITRFVIDQPKRPPRGIEEVKTHGVKAELGHPRGHLVGGLVVGKIGGSGNVRAEKPQPMIACVKVAVFDVHETEFSRRLIERAADIGGPRSGVVPRRPKGVNSAAEASVQFTKKNGAK